ncbi:cyclic pyranopterin monophosphate synthase subunit MoaA [Thermanaeromonas toyohensis ToBE]|uniref:GTP 3',8-cyclase n=1 Tax=Thermanaeromonas toyohensis ToBE TaxID=698762 RepID=A0A1W1W3I3_9FIRM|nr:cyclic pyranopterin monophosphate synthase subunit MoaA [Thermanaeromonas toyohensis ToBE]
MTWKARETGEKEHEFKGERPVEDTFGRRINYLRVSVTDRCNLRCRYCMPEEGVPLKNHDDILRLEEIVRLVQAALQVGIKRIRLTGGEPLVRKNLVSLVRELASLPGLEEISLTTNGQLLESLALPLKEAGLKRVNISLDTLQPDRYSFITRGGSIEAVWRGIRAALAAGLVPVKLNVVVVRGFNEDEILDFASLALREPLHVRFIELMPIGTAAGEYFGYVPLQEIWKRLAANFKLEPMLDLPGNGPARSFRVAGGPGSVGFIGALSEHFCSRCNRLRLTADGKLRPCLYWQAEVDMKTPLRSGASVTELARLFQQAVCLKPWGHRLEAGWNEGSFMCQLGG